MVIRSLLQVHIRFNQVTIVRTADPDVVIERHLVTDDMEAVDILHMAKRIRMAYEMPDQLNPLDNLMYQASRAEETIDADELEEWAKDHTHER